MRAKQRPTLRSGVLMRLAVAVAILCAVACAWIAATANRPCVTVEPRRTDTAQVGGLEWRVTPEQRKQLTQHGYITPERDR